MNNHVVRLTETIGPLLNKEIMMKIIFVCALVVGFTCWVTEGLTDWSWPIGATGTVIIVLTGLAWYGRKQKNPLSIEEYESEYLDRKVKQHKDGNVIG